MNKNKYTKLNDNEPTFTSDITNKQDVKDLIFSSPTMTKHFIDFTVDDDLGSDHNIITATFTNKGITTPKEQKTINLYHKANWTKINDNIIKDISNTKLDHNSTCEQINNYVIEFTTSIQNNIKENVKTKVIKPEQVGLPELVRNMIKDKKYIRKKYKQTRLKYYKTLYNKHNKEIKEQIKKHNQENWERKSND